MNNKAIKSSSHLLSGLAIALAACLTSSAVLAAPEMKAMDHNKMDHSKMMNMAGGTKTTAIKAGDLTISGIWARASFGRAVNSAGFMIIKNTGTSDDLLIAASSPISKKTELHTHIRDGQVMRMRRVEGGIPVPKGGQAALQPGGFHIMFIGLHKPLQKGETFPLTLTFKKAGEVKLNVTARKMNMPKGMMMDHSKMKMDMK